MIGVPFEERVWKKVLTVLRQLWMRGTDARMKFNLVDGWDDSRVAEDSLSLENIEVR